MNNVNVCILTSIYNIYFKVKTEQKQKAEENFIEWKTLKNKQKQQQQKKKTESESGRDFRL